jgi:formylglycine-generating enzyme required for sulfatase activity
MMGMSVNSFLTDNEEALGKELEDGRVKTIPYQVDSVVFNMLRSPKIPFNYRHFVEMGETEVTQELFQAVMGWDESYFKDNPRNPVEDVTWYDCISFCNNLSNLLGLEECYKISSVERRLKHIKKAKITWDKTKNGFRLPTENEWQFFAKAGTDNRWSGTNEASDLGQYAWYNGNSEDKTHPVGEKLPNEWGLYDMTGNVWEWCWDLYDPENTKTPFLHDLNKDQERVVRGGSFKTPFFNAYTHLSFSSVGTSFKYPGFRLCRSLD